MRPKQSHAATEDQPPKSRAKEHTRDQCARGHVIRDHSQPKTSKHSCERQDGHRIGERQEHGGKVSRKHPATVALRCLSYRFADKSANAEVTKEQTTKQSEPPSLADKKSRRCGEAEGRDATVGSVGGRCTQSRDQSHLPPLCQRSADAKYANWPNGCRDGKPDGHSLEDDV